MYTQNVATGSGMFALWDYEKYKNIHTYDDWELFFADDNDVLKQTEDNGFVPINIHSEGCYAFAVKVNEPLNDREKEYVCVSSEEYLFKAKGKTILSGIDNISSSVNEQEAIIFDLAEGCYSVRIYLISWDEEPGAYLENGKISPDALSDFVICIEPAGNAPKVYSKKTDTFGQ